MQMLAELTGVLTLNPGSSSLKWAYFPSLDASRAAAAGQTDTGSDFDTGTFPAANPAEVAVIRFVHGGNDLVRPTPIDQDSLKILAALDPLAPLHNRAGLECSRRLSENLPGMRQFAVFDTEFFHDLPRVSRMYGLPRELVKKYGIRRFGFHGFAHHGMLKAWQLLDTAQTGTNGRLVTAQLGSGCSMAAVRDGKPVDTTMGFTPNEGLLMSTRSGDIDPGLVTWLQDQEGWSPKEANRILNEKSGWLGVSGTSADMGKLLENGAVPAREAIALFRHRIHKTLGAYYALLGGLDGVVFSGGIAEHAPEFCKELITGLEHLGIHPAIAAPVPAGGDVTGLEARRLTAPGSAAACWCVRGDEHRSMLDSVRDHLKI